MKLKSKLKNTVLAGLAGLSLTACGGGGRWWCYWSNK